MRVQTPSLLRTALFTAATLLRTSGGQSSGLVQTYCSSENTAGDYVPDVWDFQSMGRCHDRCVGNYAFAILQYKSCWCSDYIPTPTVDVAECSATCPGYMSDRCGNMAEGLYGYIALNIAPSGTLGAQGASAASKTSVSSSTSTSSTSDTSSSTTTSSDTSDASDTSTAAVTSVQIVTVSGAVVYKTVTSTPIPASAQDADIQRVQQNGLSGGAIAGIVIGVLAGVAALLFGLFLLWRRRKSRREEEATNEKGGRSPKRNISVLSRSGLLGRGHHAQQDSNNEKDFDEPIHPGSSSQRHSMLFGAAATAEGVSPTSPLETTHSNDSRRHSKPMVYDQRLNPSALFATHDNGSRASMQDNADYSRTLGVTNPDPRASFESRLSTT